MSSHSEFPRIPHVPFRPALGALSAARAFRDVMQTRRSVRDFAETPVDAEIIRACVGAAATAPSGANKQPWRFVAVSDAALKRQVREGAEREEREFYERRASEEWLRDLAPLGTNADKSFLERAPWLIVIFKLMKTDPDACGAQGKVYYADESVGIAAGLLIAAIHHAGLVTLTHTPSPMAFLTTILGRPAHERPFLLLPVGYPAADASVPDIHRKALEDVLVMRT